MRVFSKCAGSDVLHSSIQNYFKVLAAEILNKWDIRIEKWYWYLTVGEGKDKSHNKRSVRLLSCFSKKLE